jgi:signal transduction histidine kinase
MGPATSEGALPQPPLLERITHRQWVRVDVALAVLSLVGGTLALHQVPRIVNPVGASTWVLLPLVVPATVPIAFRRRWPEAALICIAGATTAMTILGASLAPVPVLALPLYSVIIKHTRRQSLMVLATVELLAIAAFLIALALRPVEGNFTFDFVLAIATWFVGDSVRTRRAYQVGLAEQQRERLRQERDRAERAVVEERMEIARELHDVIAHSLSVIAIQSGVGRHVIDTQPDEARSSLAAIEETSRSALQELRGVLGVLRRGDHGGPDLTPSPTLADLEELVDRVRGAGVPVEVEFEGGAPSLPHGLELSVYRIVQEALTNVVKHARSAHTVVSLRYGHDQLVLRVTNAPLGAGVSLADSGPGPGSMPHPGPGSARRDCHGIVGMEERAVAFGGTLTAGALPDGGFEVRALLPLGASR